MDSTGNQTAIRERLRDMGFDDKVEELQAHNHEIVYEKAVNIIERYRDYLAY
jgi:hypothetical protein